jgi:uncharacterized protein with beta-barrel porin domain
LCAAVPISIGINAPAGATPEGPSDQTGEDLESQTKKRLEELRAEKSGSLPPGAYQVADESGKVGTFDLGQLSGFFNFNYQNVSKHTTYFTNGFDSNQYGGVVGIDKSFSNLVIGAAFEYNHTDGTFNSGGGNFGVTSYGGSIYGSVTPMDNAFVDFSFGYDHNDNTIDRGIFYNNAGNAFTVAGTASGNPGGDQYRVNVGSGYDFVHDNITYGPRVGLAYSNTEIDAYSESGSTGLELAFGDETFQSLTSSIGGKATIAISTSWGVLVPQISADYIHEFDADQQTFSATFVQDLNPSKTPLFFSTDAPHRDYFGLGLGAVMGLPHGISSFVNYRAIVGDPLKTTQTVTAGVRFEF